VSEDPRLKLWVVYKHPRDFPPGKWVARAWRNDDSTDEVLVADGLEELRGMLFEREPFLACIARSPGDDPVIVEVWL